MANYIEGKLDAKSFKFAIVASRVNDFITAPLVDGAVDTLLRHNASDKNIDIIKVPGSFELPFGILKAAQSKKYDAIIAVGAIIRGQTSHFDFLSSQVTKDISSIGLENNVPVTSGIITTENTEQAIERVGVKAGNRGAEAAISAIEMASLVKALK